LRPIKHAYNPVSLDYVKVFLVDRQAEPMLEVLGRRVVETIKKGGKVLVMCMGNDMRGDDAFGIIVYDLLAKRGVRNVLSVGETPENYIGVIQQLNPSLLIVVDALLGVPPGEIRVLNMQDLEDTPLLSTHSLPLSLIVRLVGIEEKQVLIVGCGVSKLGLGEEPSEEVTRNARRLAEFLAGLLTKKEEAL